MAAWQDKELRQLQTQYYRLSEEIEEDYTVYINGQGGPDASERLEQKCLQGAMLFHQLVPYMNKYEQSLPNSTVAFKRLAMLREKRGDYEGAELACVQQMRLGVFGDGSKSGMRGRLARMIKKGNLSQNKRIMAEASKYLEVQ